MLPSLERLTMWARPRPGVKANAATLTRRAFLKVALTSSSLEACLVVTASFLLIQPDPVPPSPLAAIALACYGTLYHLICVHLSCFVTSVSTLVIYHANRVSKGICPASYLHIRPIAPDSISAAFGTTVLKT